MQNRAFRGKTRRLITMIKVCFVCHGNICRSTLSESVFTYKVKELGLSDKFVIDSAATSTEEIGNPPHRGTVNKLREKGIPLVPHRAKQISLSDYYKFDYIIGMDTANIRNLNPQPRKKTGKILVVTARHTKISARIPPCTRVLPPIKPGTNTFQAAHDTDRHISDALRRQPHRSPGYSYGSSPSSYESRFLPITPYR